MKSTEHLIHRRLYRIKSRNLAYGVWNHDNQGFVGVREKFSHRYPFTEFHVETGSPHGTARELADTGINLPMDIGLHEVEEAVCDRCGKLVKWGGPPPPAPWEHVDGTPLCEGGHPMCRSNRALLQWLEAEERGLDSPA